ncbi:hypothetical protein ACOMHN_035769 [Nucella lapillus]
MEVILSQRGGQKLCLDGYMYVQKLLKRDWIRWQCVHVIQRSVHCKGAVTTDLNVAEVRSRMEHSHEPDRAAVGVQKLRGRMKATARATRSKPSQILAQGLQDASEETRDGFGQLESVKRDLRRQRRGVLPKEPSMQLELVFEDEWRTTGGENAVPFLFHDSGPDSPNQVTVFATRAALRLLSRANIWYMDGIFSMAPKIYGQIYVIRAELGNSAISCVYALICGKHHGVYEELFRAIVTKCQEEHLYPDPVTVSIDFEKAAIKAIHSVFGEHVRIRGCFYHLCQATWRKVQEVGLTNAYKDNDQVRAFVGKMDAQSFLPEDRVAEGMTHLRENVPNEPGVDQDLLESLLDYFNQTYVPGRFRRAQRDDEGPVRLRRIPPQFPPSIWNVNTATLADESRTNNFCEAWNNSFRQLVGHHHPGSQIRLRTLCQEFAAGTRPLELFLEAVARNIRLM